ncbi:MAG TPA: hypothetical protein VKD69_19570 [Vicinamibacterales bacterium]|nr:hypothetical protein [Vicinamibacterales bacterium]
MLRSQRRTEIFLSVSGLCALLAGVAFLNDEIRQHVTEIISGDRMAELSTMAGPAHRVTRAVFATMGEVHAAPQAVLAFCIGAVVLFVLMFRT